MRSFSRSVSSRSPSATSSTTWYTTIPGARTCPALCSSRVAAHSNGGWLRDALAHGHDEVVRRHDVDLAIEHVRVVEQFRDEEHPEDVVVVPFERRSRIVAVLVRREQLVEGARVHGASERRLELPPDSGRRGRSREPPWSRARGSWRWHVVSRLDVQVRVHLGTPRSSTRGRASPPREDPDVGCQCPSPSVYSSARSAHSWSWFRARAASLLFDVPLAHERNRA